MWAHYALIEMLADINSFWLCQYLKGRPAWSNRKVSLLLVCYVHFIPCVLWKLQDDALNLTQRLLWNMASSCHMFCTLKLKIAQGSTVLRDIMEQHAAAECERLCAGQDTWPSLWLRAEVQTCLASVSHESQGELELPITGSYWWGWHQAGIQEVLLVWNEEKRVPGEGAVGGLHHVLSACRDLHPGDRRELSSQISRLFLRSPPAQAISVCRPECRCRALV